MITSVDNPAIKLASWVYTHHDQHEQMTHLKLQKLVFYAWGIATTLGCDDLGEVIFEPWEHGPVNRAIWKAYRNHGSEPIPPSSVEPASDYSARTSEHLSNVLAIYGGLTAWNIRQQSHLESPWDSAFKKRASEIPRSEILEHFRKRYATNQVVLPEYVLGTGSLALDGIRPMTYRSLSDAANAVVRARSKHAAM